LKRITPSAHKSAGAPHSLPSINSGDTYSAVPTKVGFLDLFSRLGAKSGFYSTSSLTSSLISG